MAVKKFKFISPGVFIDEIDNSHLTDLPEDIGPCIIGRFQRGPCMRPVRVNSFSEFVDVFGEPFPGGEQTDVWRDGNKLAPSYAAYAAQAWLRNNSPLTVVRLTGVEHSNADGTGASAAAGVTGKAGWDIDDDFKLQLGSVGAGSDAQAGAYGLFVWPSGAAGLPAAADKVQSGSLAAVWYVTSGSMVLTDGTTHRAASVYRNIAADAEFEAIIYDRDGNKTFQSKFNFSEGSDKYIRKVFNTNPTLTNPTITEASVRKNYWLGDTYERALKEKVSMTAVPTGDQNAGGLMGTLLGLGSGSALSKGDMKLGQITAPVGASGQDMTHYGAAPCATGWFIGQDLTSDHTNYDARSMQKLFKFVGLDDGEWIQNNLKISIQDLKVSPNDNNPHGTFTVLVRKIEDNDTAVRIVERFSNCNLNPVSTNFVAKQIGDQYLEWDDTESRYTVKGNHPSRSKFIRIVVDSTVEAGAHDPRLLPFGVYGHVKFASFLISSGTAAAEAYPQLIDTEYNVKTTVSDSGLYGGSSFVLGYAADALSIPRTAADFSTTGVDNIVDYGPLDGTGLAAGIFATASLSFPSIPLRLSGTDGNISNPANAYWGAVTAMYSTSRNATRFEKSCRDILRALPAGVSSYNATYGSLSGLTFTGGGVDGPATVYSWIFSLDNLRLSGDTGTGKDVSVYHESGSRQAALSITAVKGGYKQIIDRGFDKFTTCFHGGHDGINIREKDPFGTENVLGQNNAQTATNYAYYAVKRAIDSVADPEVVDMNLLCAPGIRNEDLTEHMINVCEDRGDALAIIDPYGGYTPSQESSDDEATRAVSGAVEVVINALRNRVINSSYAATYWPWVQIVDTINNAVLWAPPSVAAVGTLSFSQKNAELWFAPAGFNRGGISEGAAGIPVVNTRQRLVSKERDELYAANINPIANFPSEGIVVFGQKTLQVTQSALDRINVRRLMIFVKKRISRMAKTVLFQQNTQSTWKSFLADVEPFLRSVQARLGLADFKVVLDTTTTTPDLVDRNIMYAKIFLKPLRAIEFIAIDFVITNSGAAFED